MKPVDQNAHCSNPHDNESGPLLYRLVLSAYRSMRAYTVIMVFYLVSVAEQACLLLILTQA